MNEDLKFPLITESEYNEWTKQSIHGYMLENIKNGQTKIEAEKKANNDYQQLLPKGLATEDQFIYAIKCNEKWVGTLWLA